MPRLFFRYGAMGSSKTANALMVCYNYEERGQKALLAKSAIDTRDGVNIVHSRIGLERECILLETLCDDMTEEEIKQYDAIVVDEAQFATSEQVIFWRILWMTLGFRFSVMDFVRTSRINYSQEARDCLPLQTRFRKSRRSAGVDPLQNAMQDTTSMVS